jgi:hypothetical protein
MRPSTRLAGVGPVAVAEALTGPAWAAQASQAGAIQAHGTRTRHAVFVPTSDPSGNSIAAFRRNADGTLALAASYRTGGNGGRASGSGSDPLASQGSLVLDPVSNSQIAAC